MAKRELIITNSYDIHADSVMEKLRNKNRNPFRINMDLFPKDYGVALKFTAGKWEGHITLKSTEERLDFQNVGVVWMRKKADFNYADDTLEKREREYLDEELEHILFSLLYSLECSWMSHPKHVRGAIWKGEQQSRAAAMGFAVPPSLISNNPEDTRKFCKSFKTGAVFKSLSSPVVTLENDTGETSGQFLPTTLITDAHDDLIESVELSPCFFQQYIPKAYELRVVVILDQVFAAKIHSQDDERTKIYSRDMSADILYEAEDLPAEISDLCRRYVQSYGLTYGALDLIVTPTGEYVFLENNPVGQFLYVEQLIPKLDMSGALADSLIKLAEKHD